MSDAKTNGGSVLDVLGIAVEDGKGKDGQKSFGRVNITLFRTNAYRVDKDGTKIPYEDAGNYDRMIKNAGCGDNPNTLMTICDKLLDMVAKGELVKKKTPAAPAK